VSDGKPRPGIVLLRPSDAVLLYRVRRGWQQKEKEDMENQLMKLSDARQYLFVCAPPVTVIRHWIRVGIRGVRLHAVVDHGRYYLSKRAVDEFFDRIAGEAETVYRKIDSRERERKAAADAVDRMRNRGWIRDGRSTAPKTRAVV